MDDDRWTDLLDPDEATLRAHLPAELASSDLWQLLRPPGDARPRIVQRNGYVLAVLLAAVAVPAEDRFFYQEVDVVLTHDAVLTVRKTPPDGPPLDLAETRAACKPDEPIRMHAARLLDDLAERYLELIDDVDGEIEELEDKLDVLRSQEVGRRIADLRHDILRIRRTLSPTRDAVRRLSTGRVDTRTNRDEGPDDAEIVLTDVYDKFTRAAESLDLARDLVAGVRDYHQAQIATAQNEVVQRLTVIASLLLVPTFIVGVYGQNFVHMPELHWRHGYAFSWGLILATTIGQLAFFRWRRWI